MKKHPAVKRGRPHKFGRPSRVIALTLPEEVLRGLRRIHEDPAWAIVTLFEKTPKPIGPPATLPESDAELVRIADRRSLIVVNRAVFKSLPGINIIPLNGNRAFLAFEPGQGMADLELAVQDRLENRDVAPRERRALDELKVQLRTWRKDRRLRFHTRSILVAEGASGRGARR